MLTLNKKTALIIGGALSCLLILMYGVSQRLFLDSFLRLEREDAQGRLEQAVSVIHQSASELRHKSADWTNWDDAYAFMADRGRRFIDSNLSDSAFVDNRINIMIFFDMAGRIVFKRGFDLDEEREVEVPDSLPARLSADLPLERLPPDGLEGALMLPEGPLLLSLRPILTSLKEGPPRGAMLWGRFLDAAEIQRLAASYRQSMAAQPYDQADLPEDFRQARQALTPEHPSVVLALGENAISGYALLSDIFGRPALILKTSAPRPILAQGRAVAAKALWLLAGGGILLGLVMMALMRLLVLSRVRRLITGIEQVRSNGFQGEIVLDGSDELAGVAAAANRLLAERKTFEERLTRLALHDHLTGLPNRALFLDRLRHGLETARRGGARLGLLYIDLDNFKPLNDRYGHAFGDEVLIEAARRLKDGVRCSDTVARVGGDEFAVILCEISLPEDAQAVVDKLLEELGLPMDILGRSCRVGASVGASVYPEDGTDLDALIRMADALMYRSKKRRKARCMKPEPTSRSIREKAESPALRPESIDT